MKSLKLNWNVLALVLGLTLAFSSFAFNTKSVNEKSLATGWFATDAQGNLLTSPYVPIADPGASCLGGVDFCAKEYTIDGSGNPEEETESEPVRRASN